MCLSFDIVLIGGADVSHSVLGAVNGDSQYSRRHIWIRGERTRPQA